MINTQINKSLLLISNTLLSIKKNQGDCLYSTKALLQDERNKKYTKKKYICTVYEQSYFSKQNIKNNSATM